MPTHKGVWISLQSQYDALTVPEYAPQDAPSNHRGDGEANVLFFDPTAHTAEVFVPIYCGSQFRILYECPAPGDDDVRYYYFILSDLEEQRLLSWGCRVGACGSIDFGIYDGIPDFNGRSTLQKKSFFFPHAGEAGVDGSFEIRVYRSKGRKEDAPSAAICSTRGGSNSIKMLTSGHLKHNEPRRSHSYALNDPIDEPYARFRYHSRTSSQLRDAGMAVPHGFVSTSKTYTKAPASPRVQAPWIAPEAQQTHLPTEGFLAKDSVALRRASMLATHTARDRKDTTYKREAETEGDSFDELEGLSLVEKPAKTNGNAFSTSASSTSLQLFRGVRGRFKARKDSRGGSATQ